MKKLIFWSLLILLDVVAVEAAFRGYFYLTDGNSYAAEDLADIPSATMLPTQNERPKWMKNYLLHPYFGYVAPKIENSEKSHGFTSKSDPLAAEPTAFSILLTGGSVAQQIGRFGNLETRFRTALKSAGYTNRNVKVFNAATGGYKQPQQLQVLSYFLALGGRFDLVINLDGFNEIVLPALNHQRSGQHPAYPREWSNLVGEVSLDRRLLDGEITYLRQEQAKWITIAKESVIGWSAIAGYFLRDQILEDEERIQELFETSSKIASGYSLEAKGPPIAFETDTQLYDYSADLWVRSSITMHRLARSFGIDYVHILQPNQYVEGSKPWSRKEQERFRSAAAIYAPYATVGYPALINRQTDITAAGVPFGDATTLFQSEKRTVYRDACCHLNKLGIATLADYVVQQSISHLSNAENARQ